MVNEDTELSASRCISVPEKWHMELWKLHFGEGSKGKVDRQGETDLGGKNTEGKGKVREKISWEGRKRGFKRIELASAT